MDRALTLIFLLVLFAISPIINKFITPVSAQESPQINDSLTLSQPIKTQSKFGSKIETQEITLAKDIIYKDNPDAEIDDDKILDEGTDGQKIIKTEITFYDGAEYSREIVSTEITPPKDKIILRGTKIVWRSLDTPDGQISYWRKLRVWATHYDSHCLGCDEWTAIGMHQGKGVIAVDPSVIKLRSNVYIPGYGKAVAGDTGGAIKGKIIDLGFPDARTAGWHAQFVDIYLL
ncbi:G5 domain-containing protein [Candidatus Daviesbacteria bacterium]|nr:G5 domain-containing protein [Candidatus Daviesbacteria bacterium]